MARGGGSCTCTVPRRELANSEERRGGTPPRSSRFATPWFLRRLAPPHELPHAFGEPRGEHPQDQVDDKAPEGEPEQHHEQADGKAEQPAQELERQERRDGDAGEPDQTPDHGILPSCKSRTNCAAGKRSCPVRGTFQKVSSEPACRQRLTSWWWAAGWP